MRQKCIKTLLYSRRSYNRTKTFVTRKRTNWNWQKYWLS